MSLPFIKMQAQGNDFVILDGLSHSLPETDEGFIRQICDRRLGIGCDQLLLLLPDDAADSRMRIFNNDGSEAENCGNGLRCVAHLLLHRLKKSEVYIALPNRQIRASRTDEGILVDMGPARILEQNESFADVEIGNLHRVFFETPEEFPTDRNVEIVTGQVANHVWIDILERGAGCTPACGSGACAAAAAIWSAEENIQPLVIEMPGGAVAVRGTLEQMRLAGTVTQVFSGNYAPRTFGHSPGVET